MLWTIEEINYLTKSHGYLAYQTIAEDICKTVSSVEHKVKRLGLNKEGKKRVARLYKVNQDYFQIPNLENSCIAGFIAADGNVCTTRNRLAIELQARDSTYLENIASLFSSAAIKTTKRGYAKLSVSSWKIVYDLERNFNITPNKSLTLQHPNLEKQNALAFIIGNLDGDGSILVRSRKRNRIRKIDNITHNLILSFSGTSSLLEWIKLELSKYCDLTNLLVTHSKSNLHVFTITGKKAITIYKLLNAIDVPKMERKWNNPDLKLIPGLE